VDDRSRREITPHTADLATVIDDLLSFLPANPNASEKQNTAGILLECDCALV
jgi:hypothetical protein